MRDGREGGRREDPPLWVARLRWRMRGSSARVGFLPAVLVDGVLLAAWPFTGTGGPLLGGLLLAGFLNLLLVIVAGGLGGAALRRRDPSLPRLVARDRAAASALVAGAVALAVGGALHRPAVVDERARIAEVVEAAQDLAQRRAPDSIERERVDVRRYRDDVFRVCMPIGQPGRAWCALVWTDAVPPRVREDVDRTPNDRLGGLATPRPVSTP